MIVKRLNCYLNTGLRIMTNERDSVRVALEAILLLIYTWNSCPVPGTDISWSLVAVGCEFAFPINFSTGKNAELISLPGAVATYSRELATQLDACCEVAMLLVKEQRAWHRELINARRPDPRVYSVGDVVFARRATRSDSKHGKVDKLMHPCTGPWRITKSLPSASYALEFVYNTKRTDKKHASDLSPCPLELTPFEPLDGVDNHYGQLYKPISASPFKEAGINGFTPPQPFQLASNFLTKGDFWDFHWPTVSKLNDKISPFPWIDNNECSRILSGVNITTKPILYSGPPPTLVACHPPDIPPLSTLVASIIRSLDKLFFVSHSLGNPSAREWQLFCVAFSDSTLLSPSCLQDGRFLVDFYMLHYSDVQYNATNQRYWLQYHTLHDVRTPTSSSSTHLIHPSNTSEAQASCNKLVPFCPWLNLTHMDTYILGPFNFATVNGHKTRNRISQADWDILALHSLMFHNAVPCFNLPSYSIHVHLGVHIAYCDTPNISALRFGADLGEESLYP